MGPMGTALDDHDVVEDIARRSGTSFYRGMRALPLKRRQAMYAIYAFCRIMDDIADEEEAQTVRLDCLNLWRARVASLYGDVTDGPVTRALAVAASRFDLHQEDLLTIIDGMSMDAEAAIRAPDLAILDLYCDRVAAAVGRLSVRIFGDGSLGAIRVAFHLGRALQLTNILRDIEEDADRGRLYLPREYLDEAGVPRDPDSAVQFVGLTDVCTRVARDARSHFRAAEEHMVKCDLSAMRPARIMGATYVAILRRLEQGSWRNRVARVSLPAWQKLWLVISKSLL